MRNVTVMVGMALAALVLSSSVPLMLRGADSPMANSNPQDPDMPRRTVKAFAPFLRAIVSRRVNQAERIFKISRTAQRGLETPETVRILGRFLKPDKFDLSLIGGRTLGQNVGILLFTVSTEEGPVAFKIYYYGFGPDMHVSRMDISDDWDQIEQYSASMENLPQPVTAAMSGDDAGQ